MHYSAITGGFYSPGIHGDDIPVDAVEITAAQHAELFAGQATGKRIVSDENGYPILMNAPVPTLDTLAARKRVEIDSSAARSVASIRSLYPDFERETWGDQEDEARAWTADNTAPTPTLTGIAEARGVTVEYLAPKVIQKADQYRALATSVAGKRQRLEDDIAAALAAEDRAGLEAIEWSNAE
ncbi:MAG TPA: hypothetical protein DD835_13360 [Halomonas sp.]|mgnify:CR=1 FL=1|nr:hypothetical protein [Halomonas sp.]|tara:strand:+ start:450 stop:998 length:549 start_codon:yes stop_codon:yes gene_type:complete